MPQNIDPQAIQMNGSYAPPTSEVGQGGALQSAEQQDIMLTTDNYTPALQANDLGAPK